METTNESATSSYTPAVYYRETVDGKEAALAAIIKKQCELTEERRQLEQELTAHYKALCPVVYALMERDSFEDQCHGCYSSLSKANEAWAQEYNNDADCYIRQESTDRFTFGQFKALDN
jgi:Tfp pilus assembly protein PilX